MVDCLKQQCSSISFIYCNVDCNHGKNPPTSVATLYPESVCTVIAFTELNGTAVDCNGLFCSPLNGNVIILIKKNRYKQKYCKYDPDVI